MIRLQNVTKDFGEGEEQIHAVHDISLTIEDGEIFGIIGLSGAGKSTLVRCINLLERPTSGSVIVDGKDIGAISGENVTSAAYQNNNYVTLGVYRQNGVFKLYVNGTYV